MSCQRKHHTSICDRVGEQSVTANSVGNSAVIHQAVVVEIQGVKCQALLDTGAGSSYASPALLDPLQMQPHQREVRQMEMMLGAVTKTLEIFKVQVSSMKVDFSHDAMDTVLKPSFSALCLESSILHLGRYSNFFNFTILLQSSHNAYSHQG